MGGVKGLFLMLGSSEWCGNLVWGSGLGDCVWRQWVGGLRELLCSTHTQLHCP